MKKFLESQKFGIIKDKCEELFNQMWDKKFTLTNVNLYNMNVDNNYSRLYVKIFESFNDKSYENYRELFDFLHNLKLDFDFTSGHEVDIYISDPELFISDMENKINTKKFNI